MQLTQANLQSTNFKLRPTLINAKNQKVYVVIMRVYEHINVVNCSEFEAKIKLIAKNTRCTKKGRDCSSIIDLKYLVLVEI